MDENEWGYHGEGNKSLVVAHAQVSGRRAGPSQPPGATPSVPAPPPLGVPPRPFPGPPQVSPLLQAVPGPPGVTASPRSASVSPAPWGGDCAGTGVGALWGQRRARARVTSQHERVRPPDTGLAVSAHRAGRPRTPGWLLWCRWCVSARGSCRRFQNEFPFLSPPFLTCR